MSGTPLVPRAPRTGRVLTVPALDDQGRQIRRVIRPEELEGSGIPAHLVREEAAEGVRGRALADQADGELGRTALEGLGDGLTLGLSSTIADTLTGGHVGANRDLARDRRLAREEANPATSIISGLVGAAAPALLTGGAGAAPALARGGVRGAAVGLSALTPGGATALAGNAATRSLYSNLVSSGMSAQRASRLAGAGGAAVDAGLSGLAYSVERSNVEDTPLTWESMAGNAGLGALLGAGLGGLVGTPDFLRGRQGRAAQGLPGAPGAPRAASEGVDADMAAHLRGEHSRRLEQAGLDRAARVLRGENVEPTGLVDRMVDALGGVSETFGQEMSQSRVLRNRDVRRLAIPGQNEDARDALLTRVRNQVDTLLDGDESMLVDASAQRRWFQERMPGAGADTGPQRVRAWGTEAAAARAAARVERDAPIVAVRGAMAAQHGAIEDSLRFVGRGTREASAIRQLLSNVDNVQNAGGGLGGQWEALSNSIDAIRRLNTDQLNPATQSLVASTRTTLEQMRTDPALFGRAASEWSNVSAAFDAFNASRSELLSRAGSKGRLSPEKLRAAFSNPGAIGNEDTVRAVESYMLTRGMLEDALSTQGLLSETKNINLRARSVMETVTDTIANIDTRSRALAAGAQSMQAERQASGFAWVSGITGGALGSMLGPVGTVLGALAGVVGGAFMRPASGRMALARLEQGLSGFQQKFAGGLGRLRNTLSSGAGSLRGVGGHALTRKVPAVVQRMRQSPEKRAAAYEETVREFEEIASNPEAFLARIEQTLDEVADIPGAQEGITMAAFAGLNYLMQSLPPRPQHDSDVFAHSRSRSRVSQAEIDSFARKLEAVEDPLSILDLAADMRLHPDHVQAAATVYPALYAEIQSRVAGMVADLGNLPPYQARMNVGMLLNIPTDGTLDPAFIRAMNTPRSQTQAQSRAQTGSRIRVSRDAYSESQSIQLTLSGRQ